MAKFSLRPNEVQILKTERVKHGNGTFSNFSDDLILTNKDLICVNKGAFGNVKQVFRYPLEQIFIYGDEPRVVAAKDRSGAQAIEISFKNGNQELFCFITDSKKTTREWINEICKILTGHESKSQSKTLASNFAIPGTEQLAETLKGTVDVFKGTFGFKSKAQDAIPVSRVDEKISKKCISCSAPLFGMKGQTVQCSYCDTKQIL